MATFAESITQIRKSVGRGWNWRLFLEDNVTGSWYQTVWIILLALVTGLVAAGQYSSRPLSTTIILILWLVGIALVVTGALFQRHNPASRWLKNNLLNSYPTPFLPCSSFWLWWPWWPVYGNGESSMPPSIPTRRRQSFAAKARPGGSYGARENCCYPARLDQSTMGECGWPYSS